MFKRVMASPEFEKRIATMLNSGWLDSLPDDPFPTDATCRCGHCDGYGNIIAGNTWQRCPASIGLPPGHKVSLEIERAMDSLRQWEGWEPVTFAEFSQRKGFSPTASFMSLWQSWKDMQKAWKPFGRILCGSNGRGKTKSSLIFIFEAVSIGKHCFAFRFSDLIDAYKRGVDGYDTLDWIYNSIKKAQVVLVDEIGRMIMSGNMAHAQYAWQKIVNLCYQRRVLLATSNLTFQEFFASEINTSDIKSRLNPSNNYGHFIEDIGDDLRKSAWT